MSLNRASVFFVLSGFLFSGFPATVHSLKSHSSAAALYSLHGAADTRQLRAYEGLLTPFLEAKARNALSSSVLKNVYVPSQADLFVIAKQWGHLSDSFRALYTSSTQIPAFMKPYVSPGGHFEIYYATSRMDSTNKTDTVSAIDTYGFGPSNWRERSPGPNGVPDYIDEVAWAFDSAWSMEIDGFGFKKPLPYVSTTRPSDRFKVIAIDMDIHYGTQNGYYYGLTTPLESSGGALGIRSYIELRNQWESFPDSIYVNHPERGIRVTAAHEFFHTIQYAMTRQESGVLSAYQIDDFPLSWLEGSAALMENIAFDSVNDYIQYSTTFFEDPTSAIFDNDDAYSTVLLTLFLYERLEEHPSIEFIKRMFFNNYAKYIDFFSNLDSTSKSFTRTWPDIYGDFFTESYFTANRSRPDYFFRDAPLLPKWDAVADNVDQGYSIKKTVPALGMKTFLLSQKKIPLDAGRLFFFGDSVSSGPAFWNVRCILHTAGDTSHSMDSVFTMPVSTSGASIATMENWSRFDSALIISTNAGEGKSHAASLVVEPCQVSLHAGDSATYSGAISSPLSQHSSVSVTVKALADVGCSVSIQSVSPATQQLAKATQKGLVPINVFYSIGFPATWASAAAMNLSITEEAQTVSPFEIENGITSAAFAIFQWNTEGGLWTKSGGVDVSQDIYRWQRSITTPGIYGIFGQAAPPDSAVRYRILAYPNPVRRNGEIRFCADGKALMQLLVYSMSGRLVYQREAPGPVDTLNWSLVNSSGKPVVPGMYYALVGYKDARTKGLARKKQKVLILP